MLALLVTILLITLSFIYVVNNKRNASKSPPGPLCLPFIGSAWALGTNSATIHAALADLAKKYGPIFRIMVGKIPMVVLNDPEVIREAFGGADPPVLLRFTGKLPAAAASGLFTTADRGRWALLRRMCSPLNRTIFVPIPQIIDEEKPKLFAELDKYVNKDVHLNPLFMHFTRNVLLRILAGTSWSFDAITPDQKQFADSLFLSMKKGLALFDLVPLLAFIRKFSQKGPGDTLFHIKFANGFIMKLIAEKRANMAKSLEEARDLLDILLLEQRNHPEIDDGALLGTIKGLFAAGSGTSADTLDWIVLFLCKYPDIQEKCYQEIKQKLNGRQVTMDDQSILPTVDNVIKEIFRLRPPAPIALPRVAERDCTVAGYQVEKGSIVIENLYGVGHLAAHYDNPTAFDPDRWLRNPEKTSHLVHFGIGPTMCLGNSVAKQEVFLTTAGLIQRYKFAISPTSPKPDFIGEYRVVFNPKVWHASISLRQ